MSDDKPPLFIGVTDSDFISHVADTAIVRGLTPAATIGNLTLLIAEIVLAAPDQQTVEQFRRFATECLASSFHTVATDEPTVVDVGPNPATQH